MPDISTVFCTEQDVFGNGSTELSDNWIDCKVAQDWAGGDAPVIEITVTTSFAGGTSALFEVAAVDSSGGSSDQLSRTPSIPISELVAPTAGVGMTTGGTVIHLTLSPQKALPAANLTHLRLRVVNSGNNTAGAITAVLLPKAGTSLPTKAYAAGY